MKRNSRGLKRPRKINKRSVRKRREGRMSRKGHKGHKGRINRRRGSIKNSYGFWPRKKMVIGAHSNIKFGESNDEYSKAIREINARDFKANGVGKQLQYAIPFGVGKDIKERDFNNAHETLKNKVKGTTIHEPEKYTIMENIRYHAKRPGRLYQKAKDGKKKCDQVCSWIPKSARVGLFEKCKECDFFETTGGKAVGYAINTLG